MERKKRKRGAGETSKQQSEAKKKKEIKRGKMIIDEYQQSSGSDEIIKKKGSRKLKRGAEVSDSEDDVKPKGMRKKKNVSKSRCSEEHSPHKGKHRLSKAGRSRLSGKYNIKQVKKKLKMHEVSSESDSDAASDTGTGTDSSGSVERTTKHSEKRRRAYVGGKKRRPTTRGKDSATDYSDCEAVPRNCFDNIPLVKRNTYYRSNMKTTIKQLKSLVFSKSHLLQMKMTPFWLLFNAIEITGADELSMRCTKFEHDIRAILLRFNVKYKYFALAKKIYKVTKEDVQLIMGVCGGEERIPLSANENQRPPWIRRLFQTEIATVGEKFILYKKQVFSKLENIIGEEDEQSVQDVARLTICYLLAVLLSPLRSSAIPWYVTRRLEIIQEAHRYDWCSYIVDILHSQISKSKNLKTGGCAMLLLFWLCEHTRLVRPVDETAFPRFLRWDLSDLNYRLKEFDLKKLKEKHLRKATLELSRWEKGILQSLTDHWGESHTVDSTLAEIDALKTPEHSGSMPAIGYGSENLDEGEDDLFGGQKDGMEASNGPGIVPSGPSTSEMHSGNVSEENVVITPHVNKDGMFNCTPCFLKTGPSFSINMTQDFKRIEEARVRVQRVVNEINEGECAAEVCDPTKMLEDEIEQLKGQLEAAQAENKVLKEREKEFCNQVSQLSKELDILRSEKGGLVEPLGMDAEVTETQFYEDPENLARIKKIEDEAMARIEEEGKTILVMERTDYAVEETAEQCDGEVFVESMQKENEAVGETYKQCDGDVCFESMQTEDEAVEGTDGQCYGEHCVEPMKTENEASVEDLKADEVEKIREDCGSIENGVVDMAFGNASVEVGQSVEIHDREISAIGIEGVHVEVAGVSDNANLSGLEDIREEQAVGDVADEVVDTGVDERTEDVDDLEGGEVDDRLEMAVDVEHDGGEGSVMVQDDAECCNTGLKKAKGKRTKRCEPVTPSTIVRNVKCRTMVNSRKPVVITPQPSTTELIHVSEGEYEDEPNANDPPELPLNDKHGAVKLLTWNAVECLKDCWGENRSRGKLWKGKGAFAEVLMEDALGLVHHASLSTWVVDSWGELLKTKYTEKNGLLWTMIFSSACWGLINCRDLEKPEKNKSLKKFVDDELCHVTSYSQLLFPLLSSGESGVGKDVGNHWTLLRFDMRSCKWRFYNSMKPRTSGTVDVHLERSKVLAEYVYEKLRQICETRLRSHKLLKTEPLPPVQSACPQQSTESVDCGVILCQNMEFLVAEKGCKNVKFLEKHSADYRARMIEWFTNPVGCTI